MLFIFHFCTRCCSRECFQSKIELCLQKCMSWIIYLWASKTRNNKISHTQNSMHTSPACKWEKLNWHSIFSARRIIHNWKNYFNHRNSIDRFQFVLVSFRLSVCVQSTLLFSLCSSIPASVWLVRRFALSHGRYLCRVLFSVYLYECAACVCISLLLSLLRTLKDSERSSNFINHITFECNENAKTCALIARQFCFCFFAFVTGGGMFQTCNGIPVCVDLDFPLKKHY